MGVLVCVHLDHVMVSHDDGVMWYTGEKTFNVVIMPLDVRYVVLIFEHECVEVLECLEH